MDQIYEILQPAEKVSRDQLRTFDNEPQSQTVVLGTQAQEKVDFTNYQVGGLNLFALFLALITMLIVYRILNLLILTGRD